MRCQVQTGWGWQNGCRKVQSLSPWEYPGGRALVAMYAASNPTADEGNISTEGTHKFNHRDQTKQEETQRALVCEGLWLPGGRSSVFRALPTQVGGSCDLSLSSIPLQWILCVDICREIKHLEIHVTQRTPQTHIDPSQHSRGPLKQTYLHIYIFTYLHIQYSYFQVLKKTLWSRNVWWTLVHSKIV